MRHEANGTVIFRMTERTRQAILDQGLAFFAGARQGQGHPGDSYYAYEECAPTPTPKLFLMGSGSLDRKLAMKLEQEVRQPGGYYTIKPEAVLVVLPDEGLIVFTYSG